MYFNGDFLPYPVKDELKCITDLLGRMVHGVGYLKACCGLTLSLRDIINMSNRRANKAANDYNFF